MYDHSLTVEQNLALAHCDKNGQPLGAPKDEAYPGDATNHLDHFGKPLDNLSPDDDARCDARGATDIEGIDDVIARDKALAVRRAEGERKRDLALSDLKQAQKERNQGKVTLAQAKLDRAAIEIERLEEAPRHVRHHVELRALSEKKKAREALNVHAIFDGKLTAAVLRGDWQAVAVHLIAPIVDDKADHALKAACAKARIEIAALVGDTGEDFNGAWLSGLTGLPLRTAQDLIESAYALESGVATLLIGTEHSTRRAFRKIAAMTPTRQREAVEALKESLTLHLLEFAATREKARRTRSISLSELELLAAIGMNDRTGWAALTELSVSDGKRWLATALDKSEVAAKRTRGAVAKGFDVICEPVGRVLPSMSMQLLANERVYSL